MKLLIQSDDYGITKAVSLGCIEGIKTGMIKNTGMFANMPWIEECVAYIKPYLSKIAFGIDLNASTGPSILGKDKIPSLVKENGMFYSSRENRSFDNEENNFDHLSDHYDEIYEEFKAQIERYIAIVGHKPDYIHNHAYSTPTITDVTMRLAEEYGVLSSTHLHEQELVQEAGMGWYVWGDAQKQIEEDPITYITTDNEGLLKKPYGYLVMHCGYVDAELFHLSSFTTCRAMDLQSLLSDDFRQWIKKHEIELITFKDLPKTWIEREGGKNGVS